MSSSTAAPRWLVYVLTQSGACVGARAARVYIGATVNLPRRLRQHNKELAGGARITSRAVAAGGTWRVVLTVTGFASNHAALSYEACLKREYRHRTPRTAPCEHRAHVAARALLARARARWPGALSVHQH